MPEVFVSESFLLMITEKLVLYSRLQQMVQETDSYANP